MAKQKVNRFAGRMHYSASSVLKACDRCGRDMTTVRGRGRRDGLVLCPDCRSDRWLIQRMTAS